MIQLNNAEVKLNEDYGGHNVGDLFTGIAYEPEKGQLAAVSKETGRIIFIPERKCFISFKEVEVQDIAQNSSNATEVPDGTVSWLKGQINSLNKKVKELQDGNNV